MHQLLQLRSTVQAASGHACTVETFLGGGGQGEVYRALLDGKPLALKWYFPEQATPAQRQNLETLIRKGPPNGQFLWPLELATSANAPGFGYLMPLREPRYKGIVDLMKGRIEPSFRALATAGLQLAQASWNCTPRDCAIGTSPSATSSSTPTAATSRSATTTTSPSTARATAASWAPRASSPRKWCGAKPSPSTQTDLFSLAVLLFYLFHIHHPLEGKRKPRSDALICRP